MQEPQKATLYIDSNLHRALKLKSAHMSRSMSELVNEAIRLSLAEDALDLEAFEKRKNQPDRSFDSFVKELKKDGFL